LQQALINPIVSRQEKANIFLQLVKKMNLAQEIGNFLKVLSFNGRAAILPAVIEQFIKICKENRGEVTAQLTIADNLSDAQVEDLEKTLGQALSKTVKIQKNVNKAILGGVILKIGSKMFDSSISGTLKNIELLSKKAIAANY
jgi:F-type H+-transporting ATPase subunit delta